MSAPQHTSVPRVDRDSRDVYPAKDVFRSGESGGPHPGEGYCIYSSQDILGTLPDELSRVAGHAARWAGMSQEEVLAVTERFERRLLRLWARRDKNSAGDIGDDDEPARI